LDDLGHDIDGFVEAALGGAGATFGIEVSFVAGVGASMHEDDGH